VAWSGSSPPLRVMKLTTPPRALGGVVNFITRKGGDEPLQATLSSGYQSATDGTQYLATVYGSHRDFAYRAAVTASQDRERETPAGTIPNTRAETDSQSLYLARQLGDHRLALRWDDHDAYSEVFVEDRVRFAFPFSEFEIFIPQRDRRKLGVFYDWSDISANLDKFHVDVYRQVSDRQFDTHWEQAAFGQENSTFSNSQLVTSGGLAQFDWQFADAHTLVTGIQYVLDEEDQDRREVLTMSLPSPRTTTNLVVDDARLETFSVFAQNDWRIRENLSLVAGIRQYWVESELRHTSRAGLAPPDGDDSENILTFAGLWDVTPNTVARLSYSQGYMYPTLLQLSIGGVDRTFVNPNPDLLPETSDTWELGLRYNSPSLQADFTVFYSEAENYIDQVTCTLASCIGGTARVPSAIYVNIGEAETLGFEGFAEYSISENLATYGSLTLMERRNIFTTFSTRKTGIPPLSGTAGVKYSAPLMAGITYWLDGYLRGEQGADEIENNGNRLDNAGWVTWNLEAGVVAGPDERVRISLGLYNLGDKLYSYATENLFAPGRSVEAKVTLNF